MDQIQVKNQIQLLLGLTMTNDRNKNGSIDRAITIVQIHLFEKYLAHTNNDTRSVVLAKVLLV